jgi:threonine dehydratase
MKGSSTMPTPPTFQDVLAARVRIQPYLKPTPLHSYPAINTLIGTEVYIKHENYQPIGVFKIRGAINLVAQMTPEERACGLITASTGNHGQSVAYAGHLFGAPVHIVVPEGANPGKVAAITGWGANVIFHGPRFDDARLHSEALAKERGYRLIHVANEPPIIAGVGTHTLEMLESVPDLDVIIVPIGGGSGASGACITAKAINPAIRVIGVQAEASPAAYQSWKAKKLLTAPNETLAEGLATGAAFELTQSILWKYLDDFVLVSENDILQAARWMLERAHSLTEGAGAAPLAAAYALREQLRGKKVGIICSGGNISPERLQQVLNV